MEVANNSPESKSQKLAETLGLNRYPGALQDAAPAQASIANPRLLGLPTNTMAFYGLRQANTKTAPLLTPRRSQDYYSTDVARLGHRQLSRLTRSTKVQLTSLPKVGHLGRCNARTYREKKAQLTTSIGLCICSRWTSLRHRAARNYARRCNRRLNWTLLPSREGSALPEAIITNVAVALDFGLAGPTWTARTRETHYRRNISVA